MKIENNNERGFWGSRLGFILAASGSAIGLGNVWKFPYIVGENGGGAFVLIYLLCIFIIGIPIMLAEFTPFFEIITKPLVPLLELMQIPEAQLAAPAFLVGFAEELIFRGWLFGELFYLFGRRKIP